MVVIGGGPAGSSASRTARRLGLRTLLIDKRSFPRDKLCGGLLTPRSERWTKVIFDGNWPASLVTRSKKLLFTARGRPLAEVPLREHQILSFCMRREFDEYLLRRSGESGTELRLGVSVKSIELSADRLNLSDGSEVRYKVLIGADGVNSQVSKTLFGSSFTPETIGFALEVEVPRGDLPDHGDVVEVEFSAASWGYGWVFPKKRTFTIGVGGVQARNPDMKENLREYLAAKDLDVTKYKVKGHFIPFGDFRTKPGAGNVLLCGDAAGVVDPITGEGIAYALETGLAAAQAAAAAIEAAVPKTAYQLYEPAYHRAVDSLVQANRWRRLIFPKRVQPLFEWAFRDAGTLQQGYLDILAGHKEYRDLYGLFVKQVGKAVIKPFRLLFRALRPGGGHGLGDSSNP